MAATQKDVFLRFVLNQQDYQRVKAGIDGIGAGIGRLNSFAATLGVGLSAAGLVAFAKNAANAASEQRALAESVGLTVEQLSALNYAAVQNETNQEELGKALFRVNELLAAGAEEGSKAAGILGRYGITSKQIRDGSVGTIEALRAIADRFNALPDGATKSALAAELLGTKLGQRLIPFLNLGSKGFDEFARKGEEAGAVLNDKVADAVAKANDKLSAFWQTLQTQVLVGLSAFFGLVEANEGDKQLEELGSKIHGLEAELSHLMDTVDKAETGGILGALLHTGDAARIAEIRNELVLLRKERDKLKGEQEARIVGAGQPKPNGKLAPLGDPDAARRAAEASAKERERLLDTYDREGQALQKLSADQQKLHEQFVKGEITAEQYSRAIDGIGNAYNDLGAEDVEVATDAMDEFGRQAARNMQDLVAGFLRGEMAGKNFFSSLINGLADLAAELAAQALLRSLFSSMSESSSPSIASLGRLFGGGMAAGGFVSGPGGPTDDRVPAMLSNGEYVIQASAVRKWGQGFLDFVNQGVPVRDHGVRMAYAAGGLVRGQGLSHEKQAPVVVVTNKIDARNTVPEMLPQLDRMMRESEQRTKSDIFLALQRRTNP